MRFSKSSALLLAVLALFILPVPHLKAQTSSEAILPSYERTFIRANLSTKVNVLFDAAQDEAANEFYGAFCELALRFVMVNAPLFPNDPDMINITMVAIKGIGNYAYSPAAETLWQVFLRFPDNVIRFEILQILPVLHTQVLSEKANDFLMEQNRLHGSGIGPDVQVLLALFEALGKMGDDSSYPVLFASSLLYSGDLEKEAIRALNKISGDFTAFCMKVILNNPPVEKLEALKLAAASEALNTEQKGSLAEAALETALATNSAERWNQNRNLAALSIRLIQEAERVSALPLVLKYYNQSLGAFNNDPSQKQPLLNAITCLAALKNSTAVQPLSLQLGFYNSRLSFSNSMVGVGTLSPEEREVALALISALGNLGYKVSYALIYEASILPYPTEIQSAAREALSKLQW